MQTLKTWILWPFLWLRCVLLRRGHSPKTPVIEVYKVYIDGMFPHFEIHGRCPDCGTRLIRRTPCVPGQKSPFPTRPSHDEG